MNLTESIKEELDKDCADGKPRRSTCPRRKGMNTSVECWQCHVHDALASRIADRVKELERVEVSR